MGFKSDLAEGKKGEQLVKEQFAKLGIDIVENTYKPNLKDYDLVGFIDGRRFTVEVKYDIYAAKSGNIALEFYNPKKQQNSGISATKADLWCHITTNPLEFWIANVTSLLQYTKQISPLRIINSGGDSNASLMLYKKIPYVFVNLSKLSKSDIEGLLNESKMCFDYKCCESAGKVQQQISALQSHFGQGSGTIFASGTIGPTYCSG